MASFAFDTHKFIRKLEAAGFSTEQAEAISDAFKDASGEADLVTKKDLQIELAPVKADLLLVKWMVGLQFAGVFALIMKAFFPA